jgi:hypothetical protein
VDRHAAAESETRSGLLTKAAVRYLADRKGKTGKWRD